MNSSYLEKLNQQQLQAVTHTDGPLLVFAGAGSGKTRVLTHRIAHLVLEHGIDPQNILAVTFTNKAAGEMRERIQTIFSHHRAPEWVATFHSICVRILRRHAKAIGYANNFAIYDSSDSLSALKRVFKQLKVDKKVIDPKTVRARIDKAKNEYRDPHWFKQNAGGPLADLVAEIYEHYQQELIRSNAMDFGDLLCNTVALFQLEKDILAYYQHKFEHVLVDEYQDTNKVQYLLIRLLAASQDNLCVVGDDDQSIYAFRGASIDNILNFQKDYPQAKVITLEQNYRSSKTILKTASSIISKNSKRQVKTLRTDNPQGDDVIAYKALDEKDEASFVVQEIANALKQGVPASEIAVFYRTNSQSRALEEQLIEHALPYTIFGGHKFYERKEIKDIIAYLKLLINSSDNESFIRIINTPARGIGAKAVAQIAEVAKTQSCSLFQATTLASKGEASGFSPAAQKKLGAFVSLIESLTLSAKKVQQELSEASTAEDCQSVLALLIKDIAENSGYLTKLKVEGTEEAESRIENIFELMNVASDFVINNVNENRNITIEDFLDRANLSSDLESENTSSNAEELAKLPISLMTLHLAKGLEFDLVFLVGLEEGLLPHSRSIESEIELEEERRLCYVGITRAKKQLYLTRARSRQTFGRSWFGGIPSRFIEDIPPSVIDDKQSGFLELYY